MQSSLYTVARDSLNVLAGAPVNVDLYPTMPPLTKAADFFALLRANLHAAALHAAMGHEGTRFRECPRPACFDAAQLIPQLEEVEPGTTDAELGTMLDQVLAELETSLEAAVVRVRSRDAGRLIPQLEEIEPGTMDAELGTILDQVQAELETSLLETAVV